MASSGNATQDASRTTRRELIPREFLRIISVWSLIPSYLVAGGFIGYMIDSWLNVFPYVTGVALLGALALAIRDMLRLRENM